MAESTSGVENKSVGRVSSFIKGLKSPLRTSSSTKPKRSKSALSRIFGFKKKQGTNYEENSGSFHFQDVGLGEEDFDSIENSISHDNKKDANTKTSTDEEKKLGDYLLLQVAQEIVTNETLNNEIKEGIAKVDEGVDKVVQAFEFTTINEKPLDIDEQIIPQVVQQLQEVTINASTSIEQETIEVEDNLDNSLKHEETSSDKETNEEKKTEDNCVLSLAQGLGKICAPWSTN